MGHGDALMATGYAKGARARGKRIAFGNGTEINWHQQHDVEIFKGNPNIAPPGSERDPDIEWIAHYPGKRLYNKRVPSQQRWSWIEGFNNKPGEVFFTKEETDWARLNAPKGPFVLIEPNTLSWKSAAINKQWPGARYEAVSQGLTNDRVQVVQLRYHQRGEVAVHKLPGAIIIGSPSFRHALAVLSRAALYIGCEGGMHHGAAAVNTDAVVIFGGFIPPGATGYASHRNLFTGGVACGSLFPCEHCKQALNAISTDMVLKEARSLLHDHSEKRRIHAATAVQAGQR